MLKNEHDPVSDLNEQLSSRNKLKGAEYIENTTSEDELNEHEYDPVGDLYEQLSSRNELEGAEYSENSTSEGHH